MSTRLAPRFTVRRYLLSVSTSRHSDRAWSYLEFDGFLSGFTRAREALGTLVLIASLSMERYSAAATVGRRYLWINALGCDSKEWKYSPGNHRCLGNGWLQEAYSHSSHPYPRHRSGPRWLWTIQQCKAADVLDRRYPRVRTRSRGRANYSARTIRSSSHVTSWLP